MEDLTTYTEVDPNADITVNSATKVSLINFTRNYDNYLYDDKGAAYFDGDFKFWFDLKFTAADAFSYAWPCGLANVVDDVKGIDDDSGDYLGARFYDNDYLYSIVEYDGGAGYSDVYDGVVNTTYYMEMERDESVGTYGTVYLRIYSDYQGGTLVDTLSLSLHSSKKDFRYIYAVNAWNSGSFADCTGTIENLDLDKLAAGATTILAGINTTGSVGTLTALGGAQFPITGASSTGQVGTIGAIGGATLSISGASAAGQVGTLTIVTPGGVTVAISGASTTGQVGALTTITSAACTLSGIISNASVGTLAAVISQTVALTGISAGAIVGVLDITTGVAVDITGIMATGQVGTISVSTDIAEVSIPGYRVHKIQHENRIFIVLNEDRIH